MNLINTLQQSDLTVFTSQDLRMLLPDQSDRELKQYTHYHLKVGNLIKLKRGVYKMTSREINKYELGIKLRSPSYLSFESVLFESGQIFQWDERVRLASYESKHMKVAGVEFVFSQLKRSLLLSPEGIEHKGQIAQARPERAVMDTWYLNPRFLLDNVRSLDFAYMRSLLPLYNRHSLDKVLTKWEAYAESL